MTEEKITSHMKKDSSEALTKIGTLHMYRTNGRLMFQGIWAKWWFKNEFKKLSDSIDGTHAERGVSDDEDITFLKLRLKESHDSGLVQTDLPRKEIATCTEKNVEQLETYNKNQVTQHENQNDLKIEIIEKKNC